MKWQDVKTAEDLETLTIGYDQRGNDVSGDRLQRWAFDLLLEAIPRRAAADKAFAEAKAKASV